MAIVELDNQAFISSQRVSRGSGIGLRAPSKWLGTARLRALGLYLDSADASHTLSSDSLACSISIVCSHVAIGCTELKLPSTVSGKSSTSKKALCASTSSSSSSSPLCEGNDSQSNHYLLSHKPDSASFRISCLSSGQ